MVRFFPKEEKFFDYFDQASDKIVNGVELFKNMMQDLSHAEEKARAIKDVEHEADRRTPPHVDRPRLGPVELEPAVANVDADRDESRPERWLCLGPIVEQRSL